MKRKFFMALVVALLTISQVAKAEMGVTMAGRPNSTLSGGTLFFECLKYAQTCCTVWYNSNTIYIWSGNSAGWWTMGLTIENPNPDVTFYAEELEPTEKCEDCEFDVEP